MKVVVRTPSRLHLGMLDLSGQSRRLFGSIGVAIEQPGLILEACPAAELKVESPREEKVRKLASQCLEHFRIGRGVHIRVLSSIPEHVGLGSGTQLALAVALAISTLYDVPAEIEELATVTSRGLRSGIGIGVFREGGFIVDGGKRMDREHYLGKRCSAAGTGGVPPVIFHHPFPPDWIFIIAIPQVKKGLSGEDEERAFRELPPMSGNKVGQICRLLNMELLPSLVEEDIAGFGLALSHIQRLVGDHFKPIQGGRFAGPICEELVSRMLQWGAPGAGQSSWGPAVFGLVEGMDKALELETEVRNYLASRVEATVFLTRASNVGSQWRREA